MYNKIVLIGNLTKDIELRYVSNDKALAKTGIAVNHKYKIGSETKDEVCFIDLTIWGRSAEVANQYLKKGSKVLIEGRLVFERWQDQTGQTKSRHTVSVSNLVMLDSKSSSDNNAGGYNHNSSPSYGNRNQSPQQEYNNNDSYNSSNSQGDNKAPQEIDVKRIEDDDIPF